MFPNVKTEYEDWDKTQGPAIHYQVLERFSHLNCVTFEEGYPVFRPKVTTVWNRNTTGHSHTTRPSTIKQVIISGIINGKLKTLDETVHVKNPPFSCDVLVKSGSI